VPEAGVAVALLSNGGDGYPVFGELSGYLLNEFAGVRTPELPVPPANPGPAAVVQEAGPSRRG
jgi:hypothetical protein